MKKFMPNALPCKAIVGGEFFKPLGRFLDLSRSRRNCPALPDELWLEAGVRRCLSLSQSGRDFLQDLADRHATGILRTTFFGSLKSKRRVIYQDPETGIAYAYLTNLPPAIAPGIVALLHKSRWDVAKVFDEFKNKLGEIKSWASTANAKTCQARLRCLTHNLMTLMEEQLFWETGIRNEAETKRKAQTLIHRDQDSRTPGLQDSRTPGLQDSRTPGAKDAVD
jgi:hypothetical protein